MSDRKALVEMLGRNRLFEGLTKKDLTAVVVSATEVEHAKGRVVMEEGKPGVGFHLIVDGTAGVTRRGRKLRTLGPGDSFGDIALIDGGPRSATVAAETHLRTLSLSPWEFRPLVMQHPQVAYKLLLKLSALLREAEKRPPL
ncbi:MAG TPA: cyclic nucleotide-binding domain-containing protein [Candidatus Dormibacteraeota bacterium]